MCSAVCRWIGILVAGITILPGRATESERLNVLFIAVDDLNTRLGCYGFEHIVSPHIDALAKRGVRFGRAYNSQYPSCGPSRASVLTGLRPDTTGIVSNRIIFREHLPDAWTLPQWFRQNGYHAARVGKIFHQDNPTDIGTSGPDDPESWDEVVNPRGRDKDEEHLLTNYTPDLPLPDRMCYLKADGDDVEQTDGKVVDETIRLLAKHWEGSFFIAAGLYRPHIPYIAPKRYFDFYSLEKTALPQIAPDYRSKVPSAALASTPVWPNFGVSPEHARECVLAFDACVSFVDAQIGRLMTAVDAMGLAERTVIVLWGDHGYHLGEHGLWRKNSLFEESTRAPLIILAPGAGVGVCSKPVEFVDIFPTVCEAAGVPVPERLDGVSLMPLLRNPRLAWSRPAWSQVQFGETPGRSVRTEGWRYTEWGLDGSEGAELYDETDDPSEANNLIRKRPEMVREMAVLLRGGPSKP